MSKSNGNGNGVIKIGRKGVVKFAFGDGTPFEVDIVAVHQEWSNIDDEFRTQEVELDGQKYLTIPNVERPRYHQEAVAFVERVAGEEYRGSITPAEALDFIARVSEQYGELADFFQPKRRTKGGSPATSGVELQFSEEQDPSATSTN